LKRSLYWVFLVGIWLIPVHSADAAIDDTLEQIDDAEEEPLRVEELSLADRKFPPIRLTIREEIEWGDFDGTDVTSFRTTAGAEIRFPITRKYLAAVSTQVGVTATDFNGDNGFIDTGRPISKDPWKELHEFSLRYRSQYLVNDDWGVMLAAWMVSRYEDGASFNNGLKGAGATGISYRYGDKITVVLGVSVSSRIVGGGASVNPFGQLAWKIDDRHTLSTSGLGLRLRSKWNESIRTDVFAKYKGRRWRLDDREGSGANRGSLRNRGLPIGVGLQWKFLKGWRLRTEFGLVAYRQLKVTDKDGDSIDNETANAPGVFGSFMLQRRF
jgi:hypothetical protein